MERKRLGQSELLISPVGIGTAPIGSTKEWRIYWGEQDRQDSINSINAALDSGVNWIDTAPFYGWGRAEEVVGEAVSGKREEVFIFTKCGTFKAKDGSSIFNLKPDIIRTEVEESLRRLKTDYIDLLQFHDVDPDTPIEESWEGAYKLVEEGKVRYLGLSNHPVDLVKRALKVGPVTSMQEQYNLIARQIETAHLPIAKDNDIGVLAWGPLLSGFLAEGFDLDSLDKDDFRRSWKYGQPEVYEKIKKLRDVLIEIANKHDKTITDVSIAWILNNPQVTGAIIGIRNEEEANKMTRGVDLNLTDEDLSNISDLLNELNF